VRTAARPGNGCYAPFHAARSCQPRQFLLLLLSTSAGKLFLIIKKSLGNCTAIVRSLDKKSIMFAISMRTCYSEYIVADAFSDSRGSVKALAGSEAKDGAPRWCGIDVPPVH
jgi:hypothetical protein